MKKLSNISSVFLLLAIAPIAAVASSFGQTRKLQMNMATTKSTSAPSTTPSDIPTAAPSDSPTVTPSFVPSSAPVPPKAKRANKFPSAAPAVRRSRVGVESDRIAVTYLTSTLIRATTDELKEAEALTCNYVAYSAIRSVGAVGYRCAQIPIADVSPIQLLYNFTAVFEVAMTGFPTRTDLDQAIVNSFQYPGVYILMERLTNLTAGNPFTATMNITALVMRQSTVQAQSILAPSPAPTFIEVGEEFFLGPITNPSPPKQPTFTPTSGPTILATPTAADKKRHPVEKFVGGIVSVFRPDATSVAPTAHPESKRHPIVEDVIDKFPRDKPTDAPTIRPTAAPSSLPKRMPSASSAPKNLPTPQPTRKKLFDLKPIKQVIAGQMKTPSAPATTRAKSTQQPTVESSNRPTTYPSLRPTSAPSSVPSSEPSKSTSQTTTKSSAPTSPVTNADDNMLCPEEDWDPYTLPLLKQGVDIFKYEAESYAILGNRKVNRTFGVSDSCAYYDIGSDGDESVFDRPEPWLAKAGEHFGGALVANGAFFTGLVAPNKSNILVAREALAFKVQIVGSAIGGGVAMEWKTIPTKARADGLALFLQTIIVLSPTVFLTNQSKRCGSGPFCINSGSDACYLDPATGILKVRKKSNAGASNCYGDSFEWFMDCAASFGCQQLKGGGQFLYKASPNATVSGTRFAFDADGVDGRPIEWECGVAEVADQMKEFSLTAARDPMRPFAIGGPFERPIL